MHEEGDALVDAVISSLLASALVWQFGLIDTYSRGISLLYLVSLLVSLALSRPIIRAVLRHFYGADPESIAMVRRLLVALDLPALALRRGRRTTGGNGSIA